VTVGPLSKGTRNDRELYHIGLAQLGTARQSNSGLAI